VAPSSSLFNIAAESGVLAAMMRHKSSFGAINEVALSKDDFMGPENKVIAEAVLTVAQDSGEPDLALVIEHLSKRGKQDAISLVQDMMVAPVGVEQAKEYAHIVKNLSVNRTIGSLGADIITIAQENRTDYRDTLIEVESKIRDVVMSIPEEERSPQPKNIIERLHAKYNEKRIPIKWSPTLQSITGGLTPGMFWVIGGFSSVGKSAVACNMALDILRDPSHRVMIVSAEMSQEQYMIRLLSILSGVSQSHIRDNVTIGLEEHARLQRAEAKMAGSNLLVYDSLWTMDMIRSETKKVYTRDGLDVLIVDFHQNIHVTGDEVKDAREVALQLQRLAKELQICIVDFSQISNAMAQQDIEARGGGDYYAFKSSGAIKDAADVAIMLRRERRAQSPQLRLQVAKNRQGPLAEFVCDMTLETGQIVEVSSDWE
jgi:replicative DNA helicase